jgi:hypothetical protein
MSPSTKKKMQIGMISAFEALEPRQLLSAAVAQPNWGYFPFPGGWGGGWGGGRGGRGGGGGVQVNTTVRGYTPSQISHAYGFDQISFSNGTVKGDGSGQTIAIVDAYDDPNVLADLKVFDQQFGIADPPSFTKVGQNGSATSLPYADAGWSQEIALDVEWAHAMAPGAKILLVEANSDSVRDLMAAVNYARNQPGVSAVSMSWGSDEFRGQTSYDTILTTPQGHSGVTFVASAGDDGSAWGPSWPASSPSVLGVGGTTLRLDSSGNTISETAWNDSGGGESSIEKTPSYQNGVQSSTFRSAPDVSYDADPNTGFAVYSSVAYQRQSGWSVVGGTSAGTPQWAALVAIANQGRALAGQPALDGATQTLPSLYTLYTSGTANASFNDITSGRSSSSHAAKAGYDDVSGLGTPKANNVVAALGVANVGASAKASSASQKMHSSAVVKKQKTHAQFVIVDEDGVTESTEASEAQPVATLSESRQPIGTTPPVDAPAPKMIVPAWSPDVQPVGRSEIAGDSNQTPVVQTAFHGASFTAGGNAHLAAPGSTPGRTGLTGSDHVLPARMLSSTNFAPTKLMATSVLTPSELARTAGAADLFPLAALTMEGSPSMVDGSELVNQSGDRRMLWVLVSAVAVVGVYTYVRSRARRKEQIPAAQVFSHGFPIKLN